MNRIIWRDFHLKRCLIILFIIAFVIYGLFVVRPITIDTIFSRMVILPLIPLLLLLLVLRIKLTYVTENGIRIGNAPNGEYYSIKLSKSKFIIWREIKTVQIYKKTVKQPLMLDYQNFLLIKTKNTQIYESFVANPKGFIQTLKKLNKHHLLTKTKNIENF